VDMTLTESLEVKIEILSSYKAMKHLNDKTIEEQLLALSTLKREMTDLIGELRETKKSLESYVSTTLRLEQNVAELEAEKGKLRNRVI